MATKRDGGLRPLFHKHIRDFDWQAVETGLTISGCPDSNYCFEGVEGWVEFKHTNGLAVKFEDLQPAWIIRRTRHGGRVWIVVRQTGRAHNGVDRDTLSVYWGGLVADLHRDGVRCNRYHLRMTGGPRQWVWPDIRLTLLSTPICTAFSDGDGEAE